MGSTTGKRQDPEARAARHASRAGTTYARFIRNVCDAGGYTVANAERYAASVIATLEERLPIREVHVLEAQLPSRLDDILSFEPPSRRPSSTCFARGSRTARPAASRRGCRRT